MLRRMIVTLIAVAVVLVCVLVAVFNYFAPSLYVYEPPAFATAAEASKHIRMPFPPEATNIRFAEWAQFIAHEEYLRFEAPVPVCLRAAAALVQGEPLSPITADQLAEDVM